MSSDNKADVIISILLTLLSAYVLYEALGYPEPMVDGAPGTARFPNLLAGLLLFLSALLCMGAIRGTKSDTGVAKKPINIKSQLKILIAIGIILVFLIFAETVEFFILLPLMLLAMMLLMGEQSKISLVTVPVCFTLFVYIVFYKIFGVALPTIYF